MVNYPCRVFSLIGALIFKFEFVFLHCIVKKQIKGMGFHHPLKLVFGFYPFHYFFFQRLYTTELRKKKMFILPWSYIRNVSVCLSADWEIINSFWAHKRFTNKQDHILFHIEFAHRYSFSTFYNVNSQIILCTLFRHTM